MEEMTDEKALSILDRDFNYRPQEGLTDEQGRAKYYPGYWVACLQYHRRESRLKRLDKLVNKLIPFGFWRKS